MAFSDVCKVYRQGEKFLVLNPTVPSWLVTNINGVLLLKLYSEEKSFESIAEEFRVHAPEFSSEAVLKFLERAESERLFAKPTILADYKPFPLRDVYLNMTDRCNLRCIYCVNNLRVEERRELFFEDYQRLLDEIAAMKPAVEIIFTGGEPLVSPLTIPVAEYANELGLKSTLLTNATLINADNVETLTKLFCRFQISVDGSEAAIHDFYRGKGNYAKTEKAIKLLQAHGAEVKLMMVVTKKNVSDIANVTKKWGGLIDFQPLFPTGNENFDALKLSGEEYFDAMNHASENIRLHDSLQTIGEHYATKKFLLKCSVGEGQISISAGGDVYPCALLHNPKFKAGNITENSLAEIYNSPVMNAMKFHTADHIDKCRACEFKLICGGSCQARNFLETGDIDCGGNFCEYDKLAIFHELINSAELSEL